MSIATFVRRHVYHMVDDKPFSIRDCLIYGSRNTIDQVFHRLVKSGIIIRVAQGVYVKSSAPLPSLHEIAKTKARAFGKTIATHGSEALEILMKKHCPERILNTPNNLQNKKEIVYAINGHTSAFRSGETIIRFIGTNIRQMKLADHPAGLLIRGLAHIGKHACSQQIISDTLGYFGRTESETLRHNINLMPAWMQACLRLPVRWPYPLNQTIIYI